jgi:hypothetical protein
MLAQFVFTQIVRTKEAVDLDLNLSVVVYFSLLGLMLSLAALRMGGDPLVMALAG